MCARVRATTHYACLQDVVGEVECAFHVRVVGAGHGTINTLVRPRNEGLVARDVLRRVGSTVAQRLGIEYPKALIDTLALLLHLVRVRGRARVRGMVGVRARVRVRVRVRAGVRVSGQGDG